MKVLVWTGAVVIGVMAAVPAIATAQEADRRGAAPALVTDRPDFTESSEVVGPGTLQIETGARWEGMDNGSARAFATPQVLVRFGVADRLELRLGGDGFVSQSVRTPAGSLRASGHSDTEIGAKLKLLKADTAGFDMAVIPALSLPTATEGFGSAGYDPSVKLTWATDLRRGFALSGNVNLASVTAGGAREWERAVTLSLARELTDTWAAYGEGYGFLNGGGCDCTLNTGVTRALGEHAQLDFEIGRGISGAAPDWFIGAGFAIRQSRR